MRKGILEQGIINCLFIAHMLKGNTFASTKAASRYRQWKILQVKHFISSEKSIQFATAREKGPSLSYKLGDSGSI